MPHVRADIQRHVHTITILLIALVYILLAGGYRHFQATTCEIKGRLKIVSATNSF